MSATDSLFAFGQRCAVCGYRRWFHWITREHFYTRSISGPMPKRGWFF
jgi:hypothetical protein